MDGVKSVYIRFAILSVSKKEHGKVKCVGVIHQNITLIVHGAHLTADFNAKNLEKIVCSTESEMCFSRECKLSWV
jgi:hypothetical protein